jgi:hypothetical protein
MTIVVAATTIVRAIQSGMVRQFDKPDIFSVIDYLLLRGIITVGFLVILMALRRTVRLGPLAEPQG